MRTRLLGIVILFALLVSLPGIRQVSAVDTVPFVNVKIIDGYVGEYEEYHVQFLLGRDVHQDETLSIVFDDRVNRAGFHDMAAGDVTIDGVPAGASTQWSGHTLTIPVPSVLAGAATHEIIILRAAMVQNPGKTTHIRLLLKDDTTGITLASNYYGVSTISRISPVSLTIEMPDASHLTILLRFRTGRNGALAGVPAVRFVSPSAVVSDTISIRLSAALSRFWDQAGAPSVWLSKPGTILTPHRLQLTSLADRSSRQSDRYQKEATFTLDTSVGELADVLVRLEFDRPTTPVELTTDDFALVWTSKEPTMVRIGLTGVPEPAPGDGGYTSEPDTTAPLVSWTYARSTYSDRLVTVSIDIVEPSLKEAYLATGTDGVLHTWLNASHSELLVINRSGIHGTIVATDKAGNMTRTPVDIPAPVDGSRTLSCMCLRVPPLARRSVEYPVFSLNGVLRLTARTDK